MKFLIFGCSLLYVLSSFASTPNDENDCLEKSFQCVREGHRFYDIKDFDQADFFYKLSCSKGESIGCLNVAGILRINGLIKESRNIYREYCIKRSKHACYMLGLSYIEESDDENSSKYFKLSCKYGDQDGCRSYKLVKSRDYFIK